MGFYSLLRFFFLISRCFFQNYDAVTDVGGAVGLVAVVCEELGSAEGTTSVKIWGGIAVSSGK